MKKLVVLALLSASVSAADRDQFYAGGNVFLVNNTKLGSASIDENNDLGGGVFIGYNLPIHPSVDFGLELEYQRLGNAEDSDGPDSFKLKGDAFYINARPKFINEGNNLYSALILGVGSVNSEATFHLSPYSDSGSDRWLSYQAGIEVGYMFDNLDFSVGYRYRKTNAKIQIQNQSIKGDWVVQGITLGVRYNF
ncbi:outer membrane beta-barrel protein [Vibrio minamisatsumaniensis]|uniref:outer membrane protein n=1 Tax=Vibrio minamisatsumaniensis TaxID=2910243 RepID=UPI003D217C58